MIAGTHNPIMSFMESSSEIPNSLKHGTLQIAGWIVPCHVLSDERRVISRQSFYEIIELGSNTDKIRNRLRNLMDHPTVAGNLGKEVLRQLENPISFRNENGVRMRGYEGEILVEYCRILITARQFGIFQDEPYHSWARAAENILLALSKVGIIALIDEATGYQALRKENALQEILERYLRKELAVWAKRFPDEFYIEMFRLKRWEWKGRHYNPPSIVGFYTRDIIYERLAPGLIQELEKRNPINDDGQRSHRHHQWLTDDIGHPKLAQHLHTVINFMKISADWDSFYFKVEKAFPRLGDTRMLNIELE